MSWELLAIAAPLACFLAVSIRVAREGERLVVLRLGRFHRVLGPGLHFIVFGVDSTRRVALNAMLPEWQSLTEQEIAAQLEQLARAGQLTLENRLPGGSSGRS